MVPFDLFHRCLCLLATAQKLRRERTNDKTSENKRNGLGLGWGLESKYIKSAKCGLAKMKNWIGQGNPNLGHYDSLLDAELAAYEGRTLLAKNYFDTAVIMASQGGFIHDCALFNERYAEFLIHSIPSPQNKSENPSNNSKRMQDAAFRIQQSIDLYREWEAYAKAECLERQYSNTLTECFPQRQDEPLAETL